MKGGEVVSLEAERGTVGNPNFLNENNYQIVSNPSTAVDDFSLKVFTEENSCWVGRRVEVERVGKWERWERRRKRWRGWRR